MPDALSPTLSAFKFHIKWAGASLGFSEVSGLGEQYMLMFSRGLFVGHIGFKAWVDIVSKNTYEFTIHLQDDQNQTVAAWLVKDARLNNHIAATDSHDHTVAIESLQVDHAGLTVVNH